MTRMDTCPQFYFQTKPSTKLESHTPFQLVYGLHPLLPIKYLLPSRLGENVDPKLVRVLTN